MAYRFIQGDVLDGLATLPDGSVQCVVTSPPYWARRDYGIDGQIGLESTPEEYLAKMTQVFREVRRVLRNDGTLWLNIGDSYVSDIKGSDGQSEKQLSNSGSFFSCNKLNHGLKPKDLIGMPWRLAIALQLDGWHLRSDIVWHKPNPMPERVRDRPTKAHEYIFLLTKSEKYFYDQKGVRDPSEDKQHRILDDVVDCTWSMVVGTGRLRNSKAKKYGAYSSGKNMKSVWTIPTHPFNGAHFATFPPKLVERCVKVGTSDVGCCHACSKAWVREVERRDSLRHGTMMSTIGFRHTCKCPEIVASVPCVVLDPFSGAGTVSLVCERLGRNSIGIELNPEYIAIAERRLERNQHRKVSSNGKEVQDLPNQTRFAWMMQPAMKETVVNA